MEACAKHREEWAEVLRIVCMFWIVLRHFVSASYMEEITLFLGGGDNVFHYFFSVFAFLGGDIGNVVFMILTGFFMYGKAWNARRVIRLWLEVEFYSILSYVMIVAARYESFSMKGFMESCLPILSNQYWFISTYMVLSFFFPVLNLVISCLKRGQLKALLAISILFFSVFPTVGLGSSWLFDPNSIYIFVILYLFGGYIRKYDVSFKRGKLTAAFTIVLAVCMLSVPLFSYLNMNNPLAWIWGPARLPVILCGAILFGIAATFKGHDFNKISRFSFSVFGIYLFHNGKLLPLLLNIVGINNDTYYENSYIIHMIMAAAVVYLIGTVIEYIRINLLESVLLKILYKPIDFLERNVKDYFNYAFYD